MKFMKNRVLLSLLAVLAVFLLPPLLSPVPGRRPAGEVRVEEGVNAGESVPWNDLTAPRDAAAVSVVVRSASGAAAGGADAALLLYVRTPEGTREMTMAEYLPHAVAAEMPAAFEPEALKAQTVALRTYVLRQREQPKASHPEADVCTDSGCCAAFGEEEVLRTRWNGNYDLYMERLRTAAAETDGQYLSYGGTPALAVFHACSWHSTENGAALGVDLPYLISVETPETALEVSGLLSTVEVTPAEFRATLLGAHPEARLEGENPAGWLGEVSLNAAGRVDRAELGGAAVSGLELRRLFALRSTDFTLAWDGARFIFRVSGYGHGVGMSQQGANRMAREGAVYREILFHYYPGTELSCY